MNPKKVILVVAGVSVLGTPLFLTAIGAVDLPRQLKSENLVPLNEWLGKNNAKLPSEGCDQSATTTPCEVLNALQAQGAVKPEPQTPQVPALAKDVTLTQTYTDVKLGFSLKYPDGYDVIDGDYPGQKKLIEIGSAKGGGLIIDSYGSTGLSAFAEAGRPQSLTDFQSAETRLTANGYGNSVSYVKEITRDNVTSVLPSGVKVLSQTYETRLFDASGKDVTDRECDQCKPVKRYVLFKGAQNYFTLTPFMAEALQTKIIQSIEYK